jgi:hypothetical protein
MRQLRGLFGICKQVELGFLEATAMMVKTARHARFQPVSIVSLTVACDNADQLLFQYIP